MPVDKPQNLPPRAAPDAGGERHAAEQELERQRAFLHQVIDISPNLVFAKDHEGRFILANQAVADFYGTAVKELIGKTDADFDVPAEEVERFREQDRRVLESGTELVVEEELVTDVRGRKRWHRTTKRPLRGDAGKPAHVLGVASDITQHKLAEDRLRHDAFHDGLTDLPNRDLFLDRLEVALARSAGRESHRFAVLFLDLDRFKVINDSLGHVVGDGLLCQIARRLERCIRPSDTVARFGGDEFAVQVDGIESPVDATRVAERVHHELATPFHLEGEEVFTSASVGIALSTTRYERPDEVLRDADTAMYRAKALGGGTHVVFDPAMHAAAQRRLQLENDLRRALARQELRLHYQPVFQLGTGRVAGTEALVRWQHPERGLLLPGEFLPVMEETGLSVPLGRWVLAEACRQMAAWRKALGDDAPLYVGVNLSGVELADPDLLDNIRALLASNDLDPSCLALEITESTVMHDPPATFKLLSRLKAAGVRLAIDDFGTGYSSLSYLQRYPIDTLKVDRSFVAGITSEPGNLEIVRTIVALAHNLGMVVLAEGVETEEQLIALHTLGCEYGQGYYFAPPMGPEAAAAKLSRQLSW